MVESVGSYLFHGSNQIHYSCPDLVFGLVKCLDEVLVYDRPLSGAEIGSYYDSTVPEPATLLVMVAGGLPLLLKRKRKSRA